MINASQQSGKTILITDPDDSPIIWL